jgi:hypothetical protein
VGQFHTIYFFNPVKDTLRPPSFPMAGEKGGADHKRIFNDSEDDESVFVNVGEHICDP